MKGTNKKSNNQLLVAIAPASDSSESLDFKKLFSYVGSLIGKEIKIKQCKDYKEANQLLSDGIAQIGWLGGMSSIQAIEIQNSLV